jgi:fatty acid-binding protein DegV
MDPGRRLDAATTAIVVDSSSDVPPADRPASWRVIPIPVTFGDETFADGVSPARRACPPPRSRRR